MAYMMVKHSVKDYGAWKTVFDGDAKRRSAAGSRGSQLFRDAKDPNSISILMEFGTEEQARKLAVDPAMKEAMERAGVVGQPEITYLDLIQRKDN